MAIRIRQWWIRNRIGNRVRNVADSLFYRGTRSLLRKQSRLSVGRAKNNERAKIVVEWTRKAKDTLTWEHPDIKTVRIAETLLKDKIINDRTLLTDAQGLIDSWNQLVEGAAIKMGESILEDRHDFTSEFSATKKRLESNIAYCEQRLQEIAAMKKEKGL